LFQIRLKDLLDDQWRQNYHRDELNQYPLACFIHAHLNHDLRSEFKLEDIVKAISNQEEVLLLLDGYDEAVVKITKDSLAQDIFNQALSYQNIIMTSRPNVLSDKVSSNFERVIENIGLDQKGIESYIDLNFTGSDQLKSELKLFLLQNPAIKSMCNIPINLAILCLVWTKDQLINIRKITTNFNLSLLYEQIIILLAKRYLGKFQPDKFHSTQLINIPDQQIIAIPIIRFLESISCQSFILGRTIISSELIKQELSKAEYQELTIETISHYGLLKAETGNRKIIDDDHSFLHLTFLEYFTARKLISDLASSDQDVVKRTANLIAVNRNQTR
jgi:predicted NACHT family NTPase